jgi:hypothetical protein
LQGAAGKMDHPVQENAELILSHAGGARQLHACEEPPPPPQPSPQGEMSITVRVKSGRSKNDWPSAVKQPRLRWIPRRSPRKVGKDGSVVSVGKGHRRMR